MLATKTLTRLYSKHKAAFAKRLFVWAITNKANFLSNIYLSSTDWNQTLCHTIFTLLCVHTLLDTEWKWTWLSSKFNNIILCQQILFSRVQISQQNSKHCRLLNLIADFNLKTEHAIFHSGFHFCLLWMQISLL